MTNLFVYGALMYDEVWGRIVSGEFRKLSGRISGYRRLAVRNEEYPGLIEGEGVVNGYIWLDVDEVSLARLDEFEGEYYKRIPAVAVDATGNPLEVQFYSFKNEYLNLLEDHDWNADEFEKNGLQKFNINYQGFDHFT